MSSQINFDPFPVLKTDRIILRKLSKNDIDAFSKIRSDENVNKFLNRPDIVTTEEAEKTIFKLNNGIQNNEWIFWAISIKGNEDLIGTICLWNIDKTYMLAEIGFELMTDYQGKGIMTEAIQLVLNYGIENMNIKRFEGFTNKENVKSFNLMKKFGFIRDEELEKEITSNEPDFINMVAYKLEKLNK